MLSKSRVIKNNLPEPCSRKSSTGIQSASEISRSCLTIVLLPPAFGFSAQITFKILKIVIFEKKMKTHHKYRNSHEREREYQLVVKHV